MIRDNWRATTRLARMLGVFAGAMWNIAVKKPTGDALVATQEKFYNDLKDILGIKIIFNEKAAKLEQGRPAWYVAPHASYYDFIVLGAALRGTFAGKGEILTWPAVRQLAMAAKYIGLRRDKKFNDQSHAKLIKNFNAGNNTIMFPEATIPAPEPARGVVTGDEVYRFHGGLLSIMFGKTGIDKQKNEVRLQPEIADKLVAQAVAVRLVEADGKAGSHADPEFRKNYTAHHKGGMLSQFWALMKVESMTVELSPQPVLEAKNFKDHFALANEAHRQIAAVIAPGQTMAYYALLPGQDPAKRKPPEPIAKAPGA